MADKPIIRLWEVLVLAVLPVLALLIAYLQFHGTARVVQVVLFTLLPFGFFPTMYVADTVRNRLTLRRARRREREQEERRQLGG